MYLSKALTCMKFSLLFYQEGGYLLPHFYTSNLDHFMPAIGSMLISLFRVTFWFDTVCNIVTRWVNSLESPYHLVAVSGAHFTQGTILIVILVSSGSAKSRTHQSAVGGFLVTRRGWPGRLRACRIWTFINSV